MTRALCLVSLTVSLLGGCATRPSEAYDIVVYGGTSGGIAAAIQVSRMGHSVLLIEPSGHLGGMTTGGLGATDIGNKAVIGGIAREFYGRVRSHYANPAAWTHETFEGYHKAHPSAIDDKSMWTFEPHVAMEIYQAMLREAGVRIVTRQRLDLRRGVKMAGRRITRIVMESGERYVGRVFIDATYEGDLMASAGVSYHVGREANSVYGETLNGVQTANAKHHQFTYAVDPYVKPGDPSSGLLPGVHPGPSGEEGAGDRRVQAYNFRLCTTSVPENRVAWPRPEGYDPMRYELLLRNFEAGDHRVPWNPVFMPNRKTDSNNNFAISTDHIGANYDYPDGDYATRERIIRDHESYQKGLMWTLAHSDRVPPRVRAEFQKLGLAKDEFVDNGHWPPQLYVREARRMIGGYVMTENNCRGTQVVDDPVGMAAYNMDSHNTQRYVDANGHARNEGDIQVGVKPYPISYRAITPRESECDNLLVPVCLSASHIAYGSIRMEPVFMVLGQSAATAAAHAIEQDTPVQAVEYPSLRERLISDGQVLQHKH